MNKNKTLLFIILVIANIFNAYTQNINRVDFIISESEKIVLPVHINDSIVINMLFDTGVKPSASVVYLDTALFVTHYSFLNLDDIPPRSVRTSPAWSPASELGTGLLYKKTQIFKIKDINLTYDRLLFYNWKYDGIFNIPQQDTSHVWELNFDHNYLEIHHAADFKMPENCFMFPMMEKEKGFYIKIPLKIKCFNGDTLTINRSYLIDTGMNDDIALLYPADELKFFDKRKEAVKLHATSGYKRRCVVNATLFDCFAVDSLNIYTFEKPESVPCKYLLGLNFLKRFNVFFDMKNLQIGLQPVKNFKRTKPRNSRYHFQAVKTRDGKRVVLDISDSPYNYYYTAGLRKGDKITSVNGVPARDINYEEFAAADTVIFQIIRKKKPMKIVVPKDRKLDITD